MATSKIKSVINRATFYSKVRDAFFNGKLSQVQVTGIDAILNEWEERKYTDLRWLAYILGTVYHETAKTMQPIEEYGKGKGYKYGTKVKRSGARYSKPNKLYYGRGLVQLTWYENYQLMGKLLSIDLLNYPEKLLEMKVSVEVIFEGMIKGSFTGKSLASYFDAKKEDWVNARKIINGIDRAELIAGYAKKFYDALN